MKQMKVVSCLHYLCLIFFTMLFVNVHGNTFADYETLYTNLTSGYNKNIRPGSNVYLPTYVNVTFLLVSINAFDEAAGKFSVGGFFEIIWNDQRMIWNATSYNGIYQISFRQSDIWVPKMIPINTLKEPKSLGYDDLMVRYFSSGNANWRTSQFLETSCGADITYYPFDVQKCRLRFIQMGYWYDEVIMVPVFDYVKMEFYEENGIWDITSTKSFTEYSNTVHTLIYEIEFKRRSGFFVLNMLMPILFMGVLNVFAFILPAHSGERVGYSITVLLSISVFLTLISETLPPTTQPHIPILCFVLMSDLVMSAFVMVCTIIGLRFYLADQEKPVSKYMQSFVHGLDCTGIRRKKRKNTPNQIEDFSTEKTKPLEEKIARKKPVTWKIVGKYFDRFCLIFFFIWMVITNIVFLSATVGRRGY